jgi:thymidylate synthase
MNTSEGDPDLIWNQEQFIEMIKTDDEFAKKWGELGPIYGKQWRGWTSTKAVEFDEDTFVPIKYEDVRVNDQIQNLINDLKTNPDSRRLMVNAWNVGELDQMVLPPCHYGFQVYTRELSLGERTKILNTKENSNRNTFAEQEGFMSYVCDKHNIPTRAISLMWNQRSVDTFLGLPFNIASYGLLLEIIAKSVNMVPDELIGNLGDTHLYLNHIEQAKEQIGRELTHDERVEIACKPENGIIPIVPMYGDWDPTKEKMNQCLDEKHIPHRTREPYPLPKLIINDEFWNHDYQTIDGWINSIEIGDFQVEGYQFHPHIKAPLSN